MYQVPIHVRSSFGREIGTLVREERVVEKDMVVIGVAHDVNVAKVGSSTFLIGRAWPSASFRRWPRSRSTST